MAIDASIYGRFQPKSAVAYAGELEQLAGMRDQRQDNALARAFRQEQMSAARAQSERANALRALQQSLAGKSEPEYVQGLRGAGYFDEAATAEAGMLKRDGERADIGAKKATAGKTEVDARGAALGQYRDLLSGVNSPDMARQWLQAQYQDPRVSGILSGLAPMEKALAEIPTDPAQFMQWRDQQAMGIKAFQDAIAARGRDANAAKTSEMKEFEFAQQRGEVPKGQSFTEWMRANKRAGAASTTVSYSQPVEAMDAQGKRVFIRTTKDGLEPAIVPGVRPPMSAAEERSASEKSARERQGKQMVSGLNDARAILDAGRATQSGVGNLIDAGARLIGQTTVGAQDAARLEALSGWLVANVPRMEGPQSNFDVQNYTTMAGKIGDRTVPIKERKAALAEVERLQRKYAEINGTPIPDAASGASDGKVRRYNPQTGRIE